MKNKAFTLIELLAVIIILGILMLIAIPSVTNYINNSRKETYVDTVKELIKGTVLKVNSGEIEINDSDTTYYVPCSCVKTENGEAKSPYGKFDPAYVVVTYDGDNYNYYFTGKDIEGIGVPTITKLELLKKESIVTNIETINTSVGIEGTSQVTIYNDDCSAVAETKPVSSTVSGDIEEVAVCPTSYTETVYWALQDTDSDNVDDKLVLSDKSVTGTNSGSINTSTVFTSYTEVPWVGSNNLSNNVNTVLIDGVIAPKSTAYWFYNVGSTGTTTLSANLGDLIMCHNTNMNSMLKNFGYYASSSWNIGDLSKWDTSNVTDMGQLFYLAGYKAPSWNVGDIKKWNTSKVTDMSLMFYAAGCWASTMHLDLSTWDTSNVTTMYMMFEDFAVNVRPVFYLDISGWNMSKVSNIQYMFTGTAEYATDWTVIIPKTNGNGINNKQNLIYGKDINTYRSPSGSNTFTIAS